MSKKNIALIWFFLIFTTVSLHWQCDSTFLQKEEEKPLSNVFTTGELRVAIENNSSSYFVSKGIPMGYHYELLQRFAQKYNLKLHLIVCKTPEEAITLLQNDECDLVTMHLTVTGDRSKKVLFSKPLRESSQVLVQRKPQNWRSMMNAEVEKQLILQPLQLAKKTIVIPKGSCYISRLENIMEEIGDTIYIELSDKSEEELLDDVAKGAIDFTICDDNDANLNGRYYPDINCKTSISFNQNTSWAVRLGDTILQDSVNVFLEKFLYGSEAIVIFNNYYVHPIACRMRLYSQHSQGEGCITLWDKTVKSAGEKYGIDWKLIASLMYQESKFDTEARGPKGAIGLMQMMPETMERYGIDSLSTPEEQIVAGIKYLSSLSDQFEQSVPDSIERQKFVIASYNSGPGHILDAQRMAKKAGRNPVLWNDVVISLLEKNDPKVYRSNEDVRHGYCKGEITARYVEEIFSRYEHYKTVFSD